MSTEATQDDVISLGPEEVLFHAGDPGGTLFLIQEGEIEIYKEKGDTLVRLAIMRQGELIGLTTCITNEARMASARAMRGATLKRVRHEKIKSLIASLPPWMNLVLKEFTIRLAAMNEQYYQAEQAAALLRKTQISTIYSALQVAGTLVKFGDKISINVDGQPMIVLDEALSTLEGTLLVERKTLERIMDIYIDTGMVKVEIERDKKRKLIHTASCQNLRLFVEFSQQANTGKNKKIIRAAIPHKSMRLISGILKYTKKKYDGAEKSVEISYQDLYDSLEKAVGVKFEPAALDPFIPLELLSIIKGEGDNKDFRAVKFAPTSLSRLIINLSAYKRFHAAQDQEHAEAVAKKAG